MLIVIPINEIEQEFIHDFRWNRVLNLHIDYATNSINGELMSDPQKRELIFFRFKDYGFVNDNRFNSYTISGGPAGIMINILKSSIY